MCCSRPASSRLVAVGRCADFKKAASSPNLITDIIGRSCEACPEGDAPHITRTNGSSAPSSKLAGSSSNCQTTRILPITSSSGDGRLSGVQNREAFIVLRSSQSGTDGENSNQIQLFGLRVSQ